MTITHSEAEKANGQKLAELGYVPGLTGASFSDFLTMKVIALKRTHQFGNAYGANALPMGMSQHKGLVRNLCVRVDAMRIAELDALTELLDCNKQEFILELLVAGMEQAKTAIRAAGMEKIFDEAVDSKLDDAGFTVAPSPSEGFWATHYQGKLIVNKDAKHHEKMARAISGAIEETLPESED